MVFDQIDSAPQIIFIQGRAYDVTNWSKHHPGGSLVFEHWAGKDATEPFTAFHPPAVRDRLRPLEVLQHSDAPGSVPWASLRLQQLSSKLRQDGLFSTSYWFYANTFLWAAVLLSIGTWAALHAQAVVAALSIALFWQQAGMLLPAHATKFFHEASQQKYIQQQCRPRYDAIVINFSVHPAAVLEEFFEHSLLPALTC